MSEITLTAIQRDALLHSRVNLADGHARHALRDTTKARLVEVFTELVGVGRSDYAEAEHAFRACLHRHTGQRYPDGRSHVTYAASVSLAVVAKHLATLRVPVGLITPTADCIPGMLSLEGLSLVPVPEHRLMPKFDSDYLDSLSLGALLVTVPNNPTGSQWSWAELSGVVRWAARARVELVLDMAFRLLDPASCWDVIDLAEQTEADVITIDDTGKVLPVYDTKLSMISATHRLSQPISRICNEFLLAVSELELRLLTAAMEVEVANARHVAEANWELVRSSVPTWTESDTGASVHGVGWLRAGSARDRALHECRRNGIELAPGEPYFWNSNPRDNVGAGWLRIALMREPEIVKEAVQMLHRAAMGA